MQEDCSFNTGEKGKLIFLEQYGFILLMITTRQFGTHNQKGEKLQPF